MNSFWNVLSPFNITDYKRFSGEIELAILNTLLEVLFRKLMGLKSDWVETFLANKLSLHFEGGTYGYLQMDKYRNKNEYYDYIKHGLVATITETIEAKGTIRTFEKGFHVPYYGWRDAVAIFCARIVSEFGLNMFSESIPKIIKESLDEVVEQINRSYKANLKLQGKK